MFDRIFTTQIGTTLNFTSALIIIFSALGLGLLVSLVYIFANRKSGYTTNYVITLALMPAIVAVIILLVGSNVARALSLAGVFSLVRYRSEQSSPKDIAYTFFAVAAGVACGIGYIAIGLLFTIIIGAAAIVLERLRFGSRAADCDLRLKISVPEDMNVKGAFDDILTENTRSFQLQEVRSSQFGTLFELIYRLHVTPDFDQKEFLDKLRTRNGNLNISLTLYGEPKKK